MGQTLPSRAVANQFCLLEQSGPNRPELPFRNALLTYRPGRQMVSV